MRRHKAPAHGCALGLFVKVKKLLKKPQKRQTKRKKGQV